MVRHISLLPVELLGTQKASTFSAILEDEVCHKVQPTSVGMEVIRQLA